MSRDIEVTYASAPAGRSHCPECGKVPDVGWVRLKVTRCPEKYVCRACVEPAIDRLLGKNREKYQGKA